jgi:3-deoxy-manno-octulosonate cytidylyltransferase (CMP-KDO synthetase)
LFLKEILCNPVEQHGKNPQQLVIAIIPARYHSTRLEGKLLLSLGGQPLILYTLEQAQLARNVNRLIVATDDKRILDVVKERGFEAVLTSPDHRSGSDRIAEVAEKLPKHSIIVNVQGDEPMIPPTTIEKAVDVLLNDKNIVMSTTCEPIKDIKDVISPDVVKVVTDNNGFALYFSRSPIPFPRDVVKKYGTIEKALENEPNLLLSFKKHTGLYVYRREFLLEYTKTPQSDLEKIEMLEQLRALENGTKIKVVEVEESSIGVDTKEDFEKVCKLLEEKSSK